MPLQLPRKNLESRAIQKVVLNPNIVWNIILPLKKTSNEWLNKPKNLFWYRRVIHGNYQKMDASFQNIYKL